LGDVLQNIDDGNIIKYGSKERESLTHVICLQNVLKIL